MRKKVIMFTEQSGFIMECGHTSPLMVTRYVKVNSAMTRLASKTLYRDCSICQIAYERELRKRLLTKYAPDVASAASAEPDSGLEGVPAVESDTQPRG